MVIKLTIQYQSKPNVICGLNIAKVLVKKTM